MSFTSSRKVKRNYDLFSVCAWYVPGAQGLFAVLGWFIVGMILGSLVVMPIMFGAPDFPLCYSMLIMYPLQFIPVLIYVRLKSGKDSSFERGYALDSSHFGKAGGALTGLAVAVATIAASVMLELVNNFLPEMNDNLMKTMEALMNGPLWVSLLSVSVLAPILEEWLCRGVILRGLLNYKRSDDNGKRERGMNPALAIIISAFFFAAIHGNIWQGITAFAIGGLFGYVYYKTGSLKLTMLMHCVNNTLSVLLSHFGGEQVQNAKSILDLMPVSTYCVLFTASAILICAVIWMLSEIKLQDPQGNCDLIPSADDIAAMEKASGKGL